MFIPIKPFGIAKARLSDVLDAATRARLGMAVAAHTIAVTTEVCGAPAVVTPDEGVAQWAAQQGCDVVREDRSAGLNSAARLAVATTEGDWLVLHADLPLVRTDDIAELVNDAHHTVLAPSHDGGTTAVRHRGPFTFDFGAGSFHAHLARLAGTARIVSRLGLAVDLDDHHDLEIIRRHPLGAWIEVHLG